MQKDLNRVELIGNIGKNPETRYFPDGSPVARFSLATSRRYKAKDGSPVEKTDWHTIVAYGALADVVNEHFKKGRRLWLEGTLQTKSWQNEKEQKFVWVEVVLKEFIFMSAPTRTADSDSAAAEVPNLVPDGAPADPPTE